MTPLRGPRPRRVAGPIAALAGALSAALAAALAAGLFAGASAAQDAPADPTPTPVPPFVRSLPETLSDVPGTWDLSRDGSTRRCVITFSGESGDAGRRLSFPAGCRRALPVLAGVAAWLYTDGEIRLVDRNVRPVLAFARRPDQRSLVGRIEGGEVYSLVPLDIAAMRAPPPAPPAPPPTTPAAPAEPSSPTAPPSERPPPSPGAAAASAPAVSVSVPGLYALDRYSEADVCRLELEPASDARTPSSGPVRVRDACRDPGLAVFDPVAWRYAGGRLTLTARRGHSLGLVPIDGGRWRRDPETGVAFLLRRLAP